jgi:hypothetical protein
MNGEPARPSIRIRFRFDVDTGEIELIVDDQAPDRTEEYHDKAAALIARFLARNPDVRDAGHIRYRLNQEWQARVEEYERRHGRPEEPGRDTQAN